MDPLATMDTVEIPKASSATELHHRGQLIGQSQELHRENPSHDSRMAEFNQYLHCINLTKGSRP